MKSQKGIGLYKIKYEMDVKGSNKDQNYIAGMIAYTSDEAVNTLVNFAKNNVKGFKGLKIDEVSFDGPCHAISDSVREAIIGKAVMDNIVVLKEDYDNVMQQVSKQKKQVKKSIIPVKE